MTKQDIINSIERRHSCRSFTGEVLPDDITGRLKKMVDGDSLMLIDGVNGKVGTYGLVSGSTLSIAIIGDTFSQDVMSAAMKAEELVLWLTSENVGSVWLGGTFRVSGIGRQIAAVIALGIRKSRQSFVDRVMHRFARSNQRKAFDEIFKAGNDGFGDFRLPLEMLRLAPSALNAQPWRAYVSDSDTVHFYSVTDNKYTMLDMGIALCHFKLTAGTGGFFNADNAPQIFNEAKYIMSWKKC